MVKDPVCGMEVENDRIAYEYKGKRYSFCSEGCLEKFKISPHESARNYTYDLVIIGAGPAGLTAAVYASVLKLDTFVIAKEIGGQAIDSTQIKNYMGFDFIGGKELIERFEHQFLHEHYLEHVIDEVTGIDTRGDVFEIATKGRNTVLARAVVIATGMKRRTLGVPGEERLLRRGVSHNLVQDSALFKGMDVFVVGGGNSGAQAAIELANAGCRVSLVSKGMLNADESAIEELEANTVEILEGYNVVEIRGEEKVESVIIESSDSTTKKEIPCRGVFVEIGFVPNTEFCRGLVELNGRGEIEIGPDCSTSANGVFACGDVTNGFGKRIIIASGEGAKAVLSARKYLTSESRKRTREVIGHG
jgi:alkyl hydroperoxide reductase subunit F